MSCREPCHRAAIALLLAIVPGGLLHARELRVERVTTVAPFPRGLAVVDGEMVVLCRGRVRGAGGVSAEIEDQAGTLHVIDPDLGEPLDTPSPGEKVRTNGEVLARPSEPPFLLWDRTSDPPERDRWTDRPYCTLRYHEPTRSLYLCAFSGIDLRATREDPVAFSKNLTDAILRHDLRTGKWYEVERHEIRAGGSYPHHDPAHHPPPHGWLNGPDNCLPLGNGLYAVSKENSLLVRYDLSAIAEDPDSGAPASRVIMSATVEVEGLGVMTCSGPSALAHHDGWLYVAHRTTGEILRLRLDGTLQPELPLRVQLVARFDPFDPVTRTTADLTDMDFDGKGRLYVVSARPARVFRFTPDPGSVLDARNGRVEPWADLASITANPRMKSENILVHAGWLYVTSGDGYAYQEGASGTIYRVAIDD